MRVIYENFSNFNLSSFQPISHNILNLQYNGTQNPNLYDVGVTNTILRIIFVFISRLGFILIELGSIPIENVYKIIFYNILEISNSIVSYALIGYMLSFGKYSFKGVIGYTDEFYYEMDRAIFGFSATLISSAQASTFLVGRIHIVGSIMVTFLYCAFFQSMLMHWIWNKNGWMYEFILQGEVAPVKDHGGALVLHLPSTIIGVVGASFLGRRIIRVQELDEQSMGKEHTATTVIGYVFTIFGYISFSLPNPTYESLPSPPDCVNTILVNSLIALGSGVLVVSLIELCLYRTASNYWNVLRCLQGGIAGLISVSSGVDLYSPLVCAGIASGSSILFLIGSFIIHSTPIEDHCNFASSHLFCGFLGILLCPMLVKELYLGTTNRKMFIMWQSVCLMILIITSLVFSVILFGFLWLAKILRSKREVKNHNRAVAIEEHLPRRSHFSRLFQVNFHSAHIVPGEHCRKKYMETRRLNADSVDGPDGDAKAFAL